MLKALEAGQEKLAFYYNQTYNVYGKIYAIGMILAPQHKLHFFSKKIGWATTLNGVKHTERTLSGILSHINSDN